MDQARLTALPACVCAESCVLSQSTSSVMANTPDNSVCVRVRVHLCLCARPPVYLSVFASADVGVRAYPRFPRDSAD